MKTIPHSAHRKPFLRAGIVAAAAVFAALACNIPDSSSTATPVSGDVPDGWICYQNETYGFEVCYPPDAAFTTASADHSRIELTIAPDTTLVEKWMDVDSREGLADCASPQAEGYDPASIDTSTEVVNGLDFLVQHAGEGAAGSYYTWTGYSTERDDVCVSLTGILHSTNPDAYSTPPPDFDYAAETAVFEQIVNTFRWLDVATPVPDDWLCYQNELYSFEVCYPPDATLSEEAPEHVRINLTTAPDTNLMEKWMDVDGRNTPPDCESPQAAMFDPDSYESETRILAGLDFLVQQGEDAAAGNVYDWSGYSTERDAVCASLTGFLHSGRIENYATPPAEFDLTAESAVFEQIVNTFRWLDAATPTPPADDSPTATFTNNTNCRRGASLNHEIITYLRKGQTARIVGTNEDLSWWLIQFPGSQLRCWVWSKLVQTGGDVSKVPFIESPVLGCWYQGPNEKRPRCVAPCPDGAKPGGVCEPQGTEAEYR